MKKITMHEKEPAAQPHPQSQKEIVPLQPAAMAGLGKRSSLFL